MMIFELQEQQQHPQARLIPYPIWDEFFSHEFDDATLRLMQTSSSELEEKLVTFNLSNLSPKQKMAAWFAMAYSHPELSEEKLWDLMQDFNLEPQEQFNVFVSFGRLSLFNRLIEQESDKVDAMIEADDFHAFRSAAQKGCLSVLNRLVELTKNPDKLEEMIKADKFYAFLSAAENGHLLVLNRLVELTNDLDKVDAMIGADSFYAFRYAAQNGHLLVLDRLVELTKEPSKIEAMIKADNFYAFRCAAEEGHLLVLDRLVKLTKEPSKLEEMINADNFHAFLSAAQNGHLSVLNRLIELTEDAGKVEEMIEADYFFAFRAAAQNGHVLVLNRLIELTGDPDKVFAMIESDEFSAFRSAAENGHLLVLDRLVDELTEDPAKVSAMVQADHFDAFCLAAKNGHLLVLNRLVELTNEQDKVSANDYYFYAFRSAAENGHLLVLNRLIELTEDPDKVSAMIERQDFSAFCLAAAHGHLSILNRLVELTNKPDKVASMIKADNFSAFRSAAAFGHLSVLNRLVELTNEPSKVKTIVKTMIEDRDFYAFRHAAGNGHLSILDRLVELTQEPSEVEEMIEADEFSAFRHAAKNGHLSTLDRLVELAKEPSKVDAMLEEDHFYAFRRAAENGHVLVLKRLMELAKPVQRATMIERFGSEVLRKAAFHKHTAMVNHLLSYPSILAYAEIHQNEYGHYVRPFIQSKLASIRDERTSFEETHPDAVFDIHDENIARACFYMIRHLIRRNDVTLLEDLHFLLDIPAVKALIHTPVTDRRDNELLRLALTSGNQEAAALLLNIPAVYELAQQNDFYREEVRGLFDLSALARDRESSMKGLTPGEEVRLQALIKQYEPRMTGRIAKIMSELQQTLTAGYDAHPATIVRDNGQVLNLPKNWVDFKSISLNPEERRRALTSYYQHKEHTAFRYLSKPNPWMADNASYVNVNPQNHHERWSTFEGYQELISLMYLAATDASCETLEGYTLETRLEQFIDELAHIGRAHNWDDTRGRIDINGTSVLEEYDDLEGDKPSCFSGVKRRLFQSVKGHPLLTFLTIDVIKQELRDFMRGYFKQHITEQNQDELRAAWIKLSEDGLIESCLTQLDVTSEAQLAFLTFMKNKYNLSFTCDVV